MEIFEERIQITPDDKRCVAKINDYLSANPGKPLRCLWFEKPDDYTYLKNLKNVRKLSVSYSALTDLNFLDYFPELEELSFDEVTGKVDLSVLKNLTSLRWLDLAFQKISNQNDLSVLHNLHQLRVLGFGGKFKKNSLQLANMTKLEVLSPAVKCIDFAEVRHLTMLKMLYLFNQKIESLHGVENLLSLKTVVLNAVKLQDQNILGDVFRIPQLESLTIDYVKQITDFGFIEAESNLQNLHLWSLNSLESLRGIEKLVSLRQYTQCGEHKNKNTIDFSPLMQLKTLREVEVKIGKMNKDAEARLESVLKYFENRAAE